MVKRTGSTGRKQKERLDAIIWLKGYLADGARPAKAIESAPKAFSFGTLRRAKKDAGAYSFNVAGVWFWALGTPATPPPVSGDEAKPAFLDSDIKNVLTSQLYCDIIKEESNIDITDASLAGHVGERSSNDYECERSANNAVSYERLDSRRTIVLRLPFDWLPALDAHAQSRGESRNRLLQGMIAASAASAGLELKEEAK